MNNEAKKDLIIGMLYALAHHFKYEFNPNQAETLQHVRDTIDEIYYSKKDGSVPISRSIVNSDKI